MLTFVHVQWVDINDIALIKLILPLQNRQLEEDVYDVATFCLLQICFFFFFILFDKSKTGLDSVCFAFVCLGRSKTSVPRTERRCYS